MNTTNVFLVVAGELCLFLAVATLILALRNRSLRRLVNQLQGKAKQLLKDAKKAKEEARQALKAAKDAQPISYLERIDEQITQTQQHHINEGAEQDISLDLSPDTAPNLRAAAIRYATLITEKDAFQQTIDTDQPDWDVIQQRYEQLWSFYEDVGNNREKANADEESPAHSNGAELRQLRELTEEQQEAIEKLQRQLNAAKTKEELQLFISSLQAELTKQQRFAQESETCIKLLEDELGTVNRENEALALKIKQLLAEKADLHTSTD